MGSVDRRQIEDTTMKHVMAAIAVLALAAAPMLLARPAAAQTPADLEPNPRIMIDYIEPRDAKFRDVYERMQKRQLLEQLTRFLSPLKLPVTLRLQTKQCNEINAYWDPLERSLNLCYELILDGETSAPATVTPEGITRREAIVGNLLDTMMHELGHGVFDMLKIPVLGKEEDAADQLSAFLMLQFGKDLARIGIKGATFFYIVSAGRKAGRPAPFYDVHGMDQQRIYNYICLGYGAEPTVFQDYVDKGFLPKERAANCKSEYERIKRAFALTLMPYIDQELMKKVQAVQWVRPEDGQ
jgi:Putative metallopeptidase